MLQGKRIVLGVTGSIAAFKAVGLASELTEAGATVDVILTPGATRFVAPLSFQAITHRPAQTDMFQLLAETEIGHVTLGDQADLVVVAPATAHTIARLALGLADDLLLTTVLATTASVLVAPAMEPRMYAHAATQRNVARLRELGYRVLEPREGRLASGRTGRGRLPEIPELLDEIVRLLAGRRDLAGRRVVVTAGGTREPIDPVRYLTNRSSGKMGYAVAEAARDRGADVTLVTAASLEPPAGVRLVRVETALDMQRALDAAMVGADVLVMAAAVADYRVATIAAQKIKKGEADLTLHLVRNPDILAGLAGHPAFKIGFAAETEHLLENAAEKLRQKGLQMIVANDVTLPG
ncbi:MAG: bifunctional phosphopantothenoylcysteine decarboxylase/phosphopantothenate--cysteine ligase CoaBC, partial [Chloroflexi bacterium]|nr:bifunctional phosphopantothenoylcysteine decarboxylase/phosphopantothenate--cysteine ligase CoaBC [Chloroflexota bacterium]